MGAAIDSEGASDQDVDMSFASVGLVGVIVVHGRRGGAPATCGVFGYPPGEDKLWVGMGCPT